MFTITERTFDEYNQNSNLSIGALCNKFYNTLNITVSMCNYVIPDNITSIIIDADDSGPIAMCNITWPTKLETLTLHGNIILEGFPDNVKHIKITANDKYKNYNFDNLPISLETLELGCHFNENLFNLPVTLKKLIIHNTNYDINKINISSFLNYLQIGMVRVDTLTLEI